MGRRSSRLKPELTASWADGDPDADTASEHGDDDYLSTESEDQHLSRVRRSTPRLSPQYRQRAATRALAASQHADSPRQRITRSSVEPELIMPSMHEDPLKAAARRKSTQASPKTTPRKTKKAQEARVARQEREQKQGNVWRYIRTTLGGSMLWLQPLLSLLLACLILYLLVWVGRSYVSRRIYSLVTGWTPKNAVCSTPVLSLLPFCAGQKTKGIPEFDRLASTQSQFDEVLAITAEYGSLPMDMKRSEASIRDLKHVVRYSDLPSRNELVFEFEGFIDTAKQAGYDLSRFNAQIGHAVDRNLSINRWTLQVIDGVAERENAYGAISRFFQRTIPGAVGFRVQTLDEILLHQYLSHTSQVEDQIGSLITSAQALLTILSNLDGRLDVIAEIVTRDGFSVSRNKDELFSYLWTKLGGNRNTVKKLKEQLSLLKDVNVYRRNAWAHVNTALLKLLAIQASLEDLRERVAVAETVGLVIPLEQHIENVKMGVERLEGLRNEQRAVEDKRLRAALIADKVEGRKVLDGKFVG